MSGTLEHLLDFTLDMRERHRVQHEVVPAQKEKAVRASYAECERRRQRFSTDVRSLLRKSVEQANRHLAARPEKCRFCESSGIPMGPWFPGKLDCEPIALDLRVDDQEVGETLVIELSRDGMIEALLWPFRLTDHQDHVARIDLGWSPVPLNSFDAAKAEELLVLYLTAISQRWPIGSDTNRMKQSATRGTGSREKTSLPRR